VEEDFHGLGIAGRVLRHLAAIARARGIASFEAEVLPENKAMQAVFARSGLPMRTRREDGVVHVALALQGAPP
jgi:ribosomal protein S18 acetylase RimI-like enzyme